MIGCIVTPERVIIYREACLMPAGALALVRKEAFQARIPSAFQARNPRCSYVYALWVLRLSFCAIGPVKSAINQGAISHNVMFKQALSRNSKGGHTAAF